jgi:hypothetical protein
MTHTLLSSSVAFPLFLVKPSFFRRHRLPLPLINTVDIELSSPLRISDYGCTEVQSLQ